MDTNKMQIGGRNVGIDLLRVIGIILIVVGHVVQTLTSSNSRVAIDYTIPLWNATLNPVVLVIELLRKTHWLADGMKATDSECDDRMLAINP